MAERHSVSDWIHELKQGHEGSAAHHLWKHYFHRLTVLARKKLGASPRRVADEEDVALDALNSCFVRAKEGGFPDLIDRTDLWRLLVKITSRKVSNQKRKQSAQKRGKGKVRGESAFLAPAPMAEHVVDAEPTPDMIVAIDEETRRRLAMLNDDLRRVARWKLEGFTNQEIADKLGRVKRTVERKLSLIRHIWTANEGMTQD